MTMRTKKTLSILLTALIQPGLARKAWPSNAFISSLPSKASAALVAMHAASGKKKNNSPPNKGGGFGSRATSANTPKSVGDIVYPDLEPHVIDTLVPAQNDGTYYKGDVLSEEMYDRLEDIYGMSKFNFGGAGAIYKSIDTVDTAGVTGEAAKLPTLFDEILSGGSSTPNDDLLSPSLSSTLLSAGEGQSFSSSFDLNSIPPYEKFRVLHVDPMVLEINEFLTMNECDKYVQISIDSERNQQHNQMVEENNKLQPMLLGQSQTISKDSRSKAQRTSTTWFHYYEGVPELMAKASRLLGLEGIERWEEPQTVRYRRNEKFTWHLDALSPEDATNTVGAGQRVATLLVYLSDLQTEDGGATMFRDLGGANGPLKVRPNKGSALLFFPAAGGIANAPFDIRTLHCGEAVAESAANEKWIAQLWLRQRPYTPMAPRGNNHEKAFQAIGKYCDSMKNEKAKNSQSRSST